MSKKIAVLVTDEFEDIEYTSPVKAYEEAGYSVTAIDLEAGKEVTGKHGEKVKIDKAISDVDASDFDALLIPGGFSPDLLRADDRPGEFAKAFVENKKPCHCSTLKCSTMAVFRYCRGHVRGEFY